MGSNHNLRGLKPFLSFYGAKWRSAPTYPTPSHDMIIEPFAGSAGYSLRYPDRDVVLVERDPLIASVWRYLLSAYPDDIRSLPDLAPGQLTSQLDIPVGAQRLIGFWCSKAAYAPRLSSSAWAIRHAHDNLFWGPRVRERIASQLLSIRHWQLIEGDYSLAPDVVATWFIDPPYNNSAGKRYRFGSTKIDYALLGTWCRSRTGQVTVCEGDGATWLPFVVHGECSGTRGKSCEVVWTNGVE